MGDVLILQISRSKIVCARCKLYKFVLQVSCYKPIKKSFILRGESFDMRVRVFSLAEKQENFELKKQMRKFCVRFCRQPLLG